MNLTEHFTLEEMTRSATARRLGIANNPSPQVVANLKALCEKILEPLREAWGEPIIVSSGYRSPKLNRAIGGAASSEHMAKGTGAAADIRTVSDSPEENKRLLKLLLDLKLPFRQLINEYPDKNGAPDWIHVSYNPKHSKQRSMLTCKNGKYYSGIKI